MKVFVVRHAETNYNVLGLCNDNPKVDVHLTENGVQQAKALAEKLKSEKINQIIISELPRTKETADIINEFHQVPVSVDPRINDIRNGFEGKPVEEYRTALRKTANRWTVRFNGGENFEETKQRVESFLTDLRKRKEECILIVTHQAIARHIYGNIQGLSNEQLVDVPASNVWCFSFEL